MLISFGQVAFSAAGRWRLSVIQRQPMSRLIRAGSASSASKIALTAATVASRAG